MSRSRRSWCGSRRCHILLEERCPAKKGAATRSRRGVLGVHLHGVVQQGCILARKSLWGVARKIVGQNKSGSGRIRETSRRRRDVELREEIRFATFDFAWLAIDLESNPKIHGECSRNLPFIRREEIGSVCTLPHVGNSGSHAGEEDIRERCAVPSCAGRPGGQAKQKIRERQDGDDTGRVIG